MPTLHSGFFSWKNQARLFLHYFCSQGDPVTGLRTKISAVIVWQVCCEFCGSAMNMPSTYGEVRGGKIRSECLEESTWAVGISVGWDHPVVFPLRIICYRDPPTILKRHPIPCHCDGKSAKLEHASLQNGVSMFEAPS